MKDAFYDFDWAVAPRYVWQDWLDDAGEVLSVPKTGLASLESASGVELLWNRSQEKKLKYGPILHPVVEDASEVRRYQPLDRRHAALFREFSALDYTSPEAALEFASKYGALGVPMQSQSVRHRGPDGELHDHHAYGEPFLQWALEICLMKEGLRLAARPAGDPRRLKWLFDRNLQHVQGRLAFNPAGDPRVALEPLTLIAAMWLQLALAVTGEKQFVACKFCRRMIEISTEQTGFRSHREFCSDSCKTMDYRKRKRTALRLAQAGKGLRNISEKTGTDTATVRRWLAAAKQRRNSAPGGA